MHVHAAQVRDSAPLPEEITGVWQIWNQMDKRWIPSEAVRVTAVGNERVAESTGHLEIIARRQRRLALARAEIRGWPFDAANEALGSIGKGV